MDTTHTDISLSSVDSRRADALRRFVLRTKRFPSYSELLDLFGVSSKNAVQKILHRFADAGYIEQESPAGIRSSSRGTARARSANTRTSWRTLPQLTGISVRGTVGASFPSPAEEELTDAITLDDYLIENKQASFLLRVSGESMTGAGIHPGDYVIVQRGRAPQHNDIVIAQVDHAFTMKRFEKRGASVRLLAENPDYPPIIATEEITIDGVVVGVVRKYT